MKFKQLLLCAFIFSLFSAQASERNCLARAWQKCWGHLDEAAENMYEHESDDEERAITDANAHKNSDGNAVDEIEQQKQRVVSLVHQFNKELKKLEQMQEARRAPQGVIRYRWGTGYRPKDRERYAKAFSGTGYPLGSN